MYKRLTNKLNNGFGDKIISILNVNLVHTTSQPIQQQATNRFKSNYSFVNWIRFVAMVSIVYEHCLDLHVPGDTATNTETSILYVKSISQTLAMPWILQPLKFGTICFFIISGYLLGKHLLLEDSPWSYYKRRLRVVGLPFLIAAGFFLLKHLGVYGLLIGRYDLAMLTPEFIKSKLWLTLLLSPYWFIFSFLVALGLFLLFWRQSSKPIFGWVTGLIALFYGVNVYLGWIEQRHNLAMPAYLFYLWIGVYLSRRENLLSYLQRLPNSWLIAATLLTLSLAVWESRYLWDVNSISPFNTVRLSNQLFSVCVFLLLLRNDFSKQLTWINPRSESFGIYLYHLYFVEMVTTLARSVDVLAYTPDYSGIELAGVTLIRFLIIYTCTLLFVKLVNKTRFRWLFGN